MTDRAPFEPHEDQLDMWKDYSTPACNSVARQARIPTETDTPPRRLGCRRRHRPRVPCGGGQMIVRRWCTWVLEPYFAPAVRFLQDQPMIYSNGRTSDTNFAHRIRDAVHETSAITDGQRAAIEKIIAKRRWVEPPRWRAWAEVVQRQGRDL